MDATNHELKILKKKEIKFSLYWIWIGFPLTLFLKQSNKGLHYGRYFK